jgi:hypothetical protein
MLHATTPQKASMGNDRFLDLNNLNFNLLVLQHKKTSNDYKKKYIKILVRHSIFRNTTKME